MLMEKHMIQVNMPERYGGFSVLSKLETEQEELALVFKAGNKRTSSHSQMRADDVAHRVGNVYHARDCAAFPKVCSKGVSSRRTNQAA
jgi:hypothetical protein